MNTVIVKQCGRPGKDSQTFRAYAPVDLPKVRENKSLGVSASTTGNVSWGVIHCAAKAFMKFTEPQADIDEVETRISITEMSPGLWVAELQSK
ncbi:MAG TPA: hypothetical protein VG347_05865 [Verrucomicrobiae bacterium]|nr:hypothetical protein [Verrucomicrobiae bacterium]